MKEIVLSFGGLWMGERVAKISTFLNEKFALCH